MPGVLFGNNRLVLADWPVDTKRRVKQIDKRVLGVWRPVRVNQVSIGNVVVKRLIAISDAFWYENCRARVNFVRENSTEAVTFAQITPCAEDAAVGGGDELVPRLGVQAAGGASFIVEADIVLHDVERRQPQRFHFFFLVVFLEPAAVVAVDGQFDNEQPRNGRFGDGEFVVVVWVEAHRLSFRHS